MKVVHGALADDPQFRERFRREVEMARAVGGFWTAAVVAADPTADVPWLASEYVPGPTVQQAVDLHGPLPERTVWRLAAGLAEALVAIHDTGLVHRDVKPSNVLLAANGPRLIDFGISRALDHGTLTATGAFFGTPGFLAPEQIAGMGVGPASDIFSLGAVLVFAATAAGPYGTGAVAELVARVACGPPDLGAVPGRLRPLLARCLASDPAARPTPARVLEVVDRSGQADGPNDDWLPPPVRTLVAEQAPTIVPAQPAPGIAEVPRPSASGNGPAPSAVANGDRSTFDAGRHWAGLWVVLCALLTWWGASAAQGGPGIGAAGRLLGVVAFVYGAIRTVRYLSRALRAGVQLDVDRSGLTVRRGKHGSAIAWPAVARVGVTGDEKEPWLMVWLSAGAPPLRLGGTSWAVSTGPCGCSVWATTASALGAGARYERYAPRWRGTRRSVTTPTCDGPP